MLGRGYVLPKWRSDAAHQADVSLHAFIRQPFARAMLTTCRGSGYAESPFTDLLAYLGLVLALL